MQVISRLFRTYSPSRRPHWACVAAVILLALVSTERVQAQQVQSGVSTGAVNIPQTNLVPVTQPGPATSSLGQFDPYSNNPTSNFGTGTTLGPPPTMGGTPGIVPSGTPGIAPSGTPGIAPSGTPGIAPGYGTAPSVPGAYPPPTPSSNLGGVPPGSGVTVIGPPSSAAQPTTITPSNTIAPSPPGGSLFSRIFSQPASAPMQPSFQTTIEGSAVPNSSTIYGVPPQGTIGPYSGTFDNSNVYGPPTGGYAPPPYPSTIYPSETPATLFPDGMFPNGVFYSDPNSLYRLLRGPRFRHGFVTGGEDPFKLGMNDTDVSLVLSCPNFLYSTQALYVIPSFSLHLWDGPDGRTGSDLPPNAYSAFLDLGWTSDPLRMFSTEFGVRVGVFTDFDTYNSDSIRVLGKGLVNFRLTPAQTLKAGVYYVDRNSIKLVPAGGIICQPNPYTKFDIFFPQPKYARYWRTVGTRDVWWYILGDYGGGSWTISRTDLTEDSIDINDYRLIGGFEWGTSDAIRLGRRTGFFELGWVFSREVEYRFNPQDNYKPKDGFMIRAGLGY